MSSRAANSVLAATVHVGAVRAVREEGDVYFHQAVPADTDGASGGDLEAIASPSTSPIA